MGADFFEINFVELVVVVEDFSGVRLSDLLQIHVEGLTIEIGYKRVEDVNCSLECFGVFRVDFGMIIAFNG